MNRRWAFALVGAAAVIAGVVWYARNEPGTGDGPPADAPNDPVLEERAARDALRDRPDDPHARLRLARALRRQGRSGEAEGELLRAIRSGLPEPESKREYVLILAAQDWPSKWEGLFQQVVRDNPDDTDLLSAVADSYSATGRWERAEPVYTRLLARDGEQTEWRFKRGVARMRAANYATAAEDFRAVLSRDPDRYEARLFLAHSLLGDARMTDAERELRACHRQRPDQAEPLVGLATCAVERDDLGAAEALLGRAAELAGRSPLVLQEQATLYLRQQRTDLALATLTRLVAIDPNHRQAHLQLAQSYLAVGNADAARHHEEVYKELDRKEDARLAARRGMR
jgi:thioredoxin-like negative regulator of GroEL